MKILNLLFIILSYRKYFLHILFFEFYYLVKGYKQSSVNIINNNNFTDNIPCSYFFLHKIIKFLFNNHIKSLIDLGCGGGRSIYFFNKKLKIKYYGIEYHAPIFDSCKKLFQKYDNVKILNGDILSFNFLDLDNDCFFINDPLRKKDDFDRLISKITEKYEKNKKLIYFILININENKRKIFNKYKLIDSIQIKSKGYYIYSNEKIL